MKYLSKFWQGKNKNSESERDDIIQTIKDILLDIEDLGFNIEYKYDTPFNNTHISITHADNTLDRFNTSITKFKITDDIKEPLMRVSSLLDIYGYKENLRGYWRYGSTKEDKFHIYPDNRGIRTQGYNMDENWPEMYSLRLIIDHDLL
jgi:hypothetical protein